MRFAVALALSFAAVPALAASKPKDDCQPFKLPDGYTAQKMTPAQYHFMEGVWAVLPSTPPGFPPGDGASIVIKTADKKTNVIFFTKGDGDKQLVCFILPGGDQLLKDLKTLKDGPGETL